MKALPLWQPWASLVAMGAKRVETRSWPAPAAILGERVAIHACKTRDHIALCETFPFDRHIRDAAHLPLGALVGTVLVVRCSEITDASADALEESLPEEFALGNYMSGRFAWVLRDAQPFVEPVPFRGMQGIFDVPDELALRRSRAAA